jgi:hypothetical protein
MKKKDIIRKILAATKPIMQPVDLAAWTKEIRQVNQGPHSGTFKSKNTEKILQRESGAERDVLKILDDMPQVIWIGTQCITFSYMGADFDYTYTPDIVCQLYNQQVLIIEVKPVTTVCDYLNYRKYVTAIEHCRQNNWHYLILSSKDGAIEDMATEHVSPVVEKKFLKEISEKFTDRYNGVGIEFIKQFQSGYSVTDKEITAIALRNDLTLFRNPYNWGRLPQEWSWKNVLRDSGDTADLSS